MEDELRQLVQSSSEYVCLLSPHSSKIFFGCSEHGVGFSQSENVPLTAERLKSVLVSVIRESLPRASRSAVVRWYFWISPQTFSERPIMTETFATEWVQVPFFRKRAVIPMFDTFCSNVLEIGPWPCRTALFGFEVVTRALQELGCNHSLLGANYVLAPRVLTTSLIAVHQHNM